MKVGRKKGIPFFCLHKTGWVVYAYPFIGSADDVGLAYGNALPVYQRYFFLKGPIIIKYKYTIEGVCQVYQPVVVNDLLRRNGLIENTPEIGGLH